MMALPFAKEHNVCYWFPGIEPALSVSRYEWAKHFSYLFDAVLNRRLRCSAGTILAAADAEAISGFYYVLVVFWMVVPFDFSDWVDTELFHPGCLFTARKCYRSLRKKLL